MTGEVTGAEPFIIASYAISAAVLLGLGLWTVFRLISAKKRVVMLDAARKEDQTQA